MIAVSKLAFFLGFLFPRGCESRSVGDLVLSVGYKQYKGRDMCVCVIVGGGGVLM